MTDAWTWLLENEEVVRRTIRWRVGKDHEDESFQRIALRIHNIMNTYDPRKGASLKTHMLRNISWYAWKHSCSPYGHWKEKDWEVLPDDVLGPPPAESKLELVEILEQLEDYDRTLLILYHMYDFTFQEIADKLGIVKGTARNHYLRAMKRAQELAV